MVTGKNFHIIMHYCPCGLFFIIRKQILIEARFLLFHYLPKYPSKISSIQRVKGLTFYLKETPFNTFANRADPDQAALVSLLFAYGNLIRYDPTLVDLTSNICSMYKRESLFT